MNELELKLKRIQEKLQLLLKQHNSLQKENQRLIAELDEKKSTSIKNLQQVDALKQQVEVLKITSGNWNEADKIEFEKRITNYIKEIDNCIDYLSQP